MEDFRLEAPSLRAIKREGGEKNRIMIFGDDGTYVVELGPDAPLSLTATIFQTGDGGRSWAEAHHHKGIRTGIAALTFAAVVNAPLPAMADTFVFNASAG
jgi:hypothetical protein